MIEQFREWAGAESTWGLALVLFGVAAQLLFMARWLVQWAVSEKRRASHIPESFWWMSLAGATLLWVYFLLRREPVGLLGQSFGWIVYARNLMLLRRDSAPPDESP